MSWRIVPLLMVFVAMAHFNRVSISVAGTEQIIQAGLLSPTQMGLVYSSFLLVYTIFMIPGGLFIDRFGPRAAWMILGFGATAGVALTGLVGLAFTEAGPLLLGLLAVRSLLGMFNAPLHPSGARLVANWVPPGGVALGNGLVTFSACIGMASTYLVFGMLIDRFGWPQAFLVTSGATLLVALLWTLYASDYPSKIAAQSGTPVLSPGSESDRFTKPSGIRTPPPRPGQFTTLPGIRPLPPESGRFTKPLANLSLLCLTLSYGMLGYFQYLFFYWAEYYFEEVLHYSTEISRRNSSLLTLAMGVGMVLGGFLSDRAIVWFGARRGLAIVPIAGFLLGAAATLSGVFTVSPEVLLISFAVAMAAVGSCEGSFWTAAVRIGGAQGGTAAAILNTGGNAIGLLAPVASPVIAEWLGWKAVLLVASGACLGGAVLWWGVIAGDSLDDPAHYVNDGSGKVPLRS